jgi:hypothetical protein
LEVLEFTAQSRALERPQGILHHGAERLVLFARYCVGIGGKILRQRDGFFDSFTHEGKNVSIERRQHILDLVVVAADRIELPAAVHECRDPRNDIYLALALAGAADVIVSSDTHDLLPMHPCRGIQILSPANYLSF